jgi:RNA polymerase sigma-70 factor (ECF subfamily)
MTESHENTGSNGAAPSPTTTSRSLLERVKADDAAAWERLVGLYAPLVLHWCRRWGLRDEDAADVFQEVFQAVATHIGGFHRERPGDTFRGWLHTITHNKVRDHHRRRGREPEGVGGTDALSRLAQVPAPAEPDEDAADHNRAERDLFRRALELIRSEFAERTWQAFWRTAVDGRATQDVAAELAMTPGAVRVAKSRVLQRLREEMGDLPEDTPG